MEAEAYLLSGYGIRSAFEAHPKGWVNFSKYASVTQPSRTKGTQVGPEFGIPFLAATQVFDVRPIPRKWLAPEKIQHATSLYVKDGDILVTRSGSVGRATLAYTPHLDTLVSDDLLRVHPRDEQNWGWIYAYLRTPTARAMMTSAQYGHIIKHLEVSHLNALPIPELPEPLLEHFCACVRSVLTLREQAHAAMTQAEKLFEERLGPFTPTANGERGFNVLASETLFAKNRRLDGWRHNPLVQSIYAHLKANGQALEPLQACGYKVWVPGRYKRIPAEDGVTFLDSSDLFEINPDLSKRFADCKFGDEYWGRVQRDWLLMASSGQTYGIIGGVVLASAFYDDKVVANHVLRIAPDVGAKIRPGYLLVTLSHPVFGRPIIKSFAFGSSVPEIAPEYIENFSVVRLAPEHENLIADRAEVATRLRAEADILENSLSDEAETMLNNFLATGSITQIKML